MKTGLITSDTYQNHNTGDGHPEKIDRVTVIIDNFKKLDNKDLIWKKPSKFDRSLLEITHNSDYINFVEKSFPEKGLSFLDGDTIVSPGSKDATSDAVGSIITAIDGVQNKDFKNAFCAVRPPGHHAEKNKAMGFCIYNNVAVGANYLINKYKLKKIAIIDFDVHHGNGTQDIFYDNEKVLYISTHQYPYYPGSGTNDEKGKHNNILNIPLPAGTTSEEYLNAYEFVLKKIKEFKPEFILLSAGFDAHKNDPLAQLQLESKDFYSITKRTLELSKQYCDGKVVSILEGGYDLLALQESTVQRSRDFDGPFRYLVIDFVGPQRPVYEQQKAIGYESEFIEGEKECTKYMKGMFDDWQATGITSVLHEKKGGYAFNKASIKALEEKTNTNGVNIIKGVTVSGFKKSSTSKAVNGVETDKGIIECEQVVVGAGPWVRDFWNMLELPKVANIKGQDGKFHKEDMWKYWMLQEGVIGVDKDFLRMNDGGQPPVMHVDSTAPLYSDTTKKLITDELWVNAKLKIIKT